MLSMSDWSKLCICQILEEEKCCLYQIKSFTSQNKFQAVRMGKCSIQTSHAMVDIGGSDKKTYYDKCVTIAAVKKYI